MAVPDSSVFGQDTAKVIMENPIERSFKNRYPSPMFSSEVGTGIPGLTVVFVFDASQLAKDPIIPRPWVKIDSNSYYSLDSRGIGEAMKKINFIPSNETEAMNAAKLMMIGEHTFNIIFETDSLFPKELEALKRNEIRKLGIQKPKFEKNGDTYKIVYYAFIRETDYFHQGAISYYINKVICQVGPSIYYVSQSQIWSLEVEIK